MNMLSGIPKPIRNWNQFKEKVKTLGYSMHWRRWPDSNTLHISRDYRRDGIDIHYAYERGIHTKTKNLMESKKTILADALAIVEDLKGRLDRVDRLMPIAQALRGEGSHPPVITVGYIEIPAHRYTIRVHDDCLVQVLITAQFHTSPAEDLENEIRIMTRMKEEYEERLEPFLS
jgi:hypothetical protein